MCTFKCRGQVFSDSAAPLAGPVVQGIVQSCRIPSQARVRQRLAGHAFQGVTLRSAVGHDHDLGHVGKAAHFTLDSPLQSHLDVRLYTDAEDLRSGNVS